MTESAAAPSKAQGVMVALSDAQKALVRVQQALLDANKLAIQIPMYERLGKMITEIRHMMIDAPKLPL
jgi:hypothetical protein